MGVLPYLLADGRPLALGAPEPALRSLPESLSLLPLFRGALDLEVFSVQFVENE